VKPLKRIKTISALDAITDQERADPGLAVLVADEERKLHLGLRIQEMREAAGLTQTALAKRIGSSQPAIARLESGEYERVSLTTLRKISSALGYSLSVNFTRRRGTAVSLRAKSSER
jgi:DNA-binding XRE family transcriptional regulator